MTISLQLLITFIENTCFLKQCKKQVSLRRSYKQSFAGKWCRVSDLTHRHKSVNIQSVLTIPNLKSWLLVITTPRMTTVLEIRHLLKNFHNLWKRRVAVYEGNACQHDSEQSFKRQWWKYRFWKTRSPVTAIEERISPYLEQTTCSVKYAFDNLHTK